MAAPLLRALALAAAPAAVLAAPTGTTVTLNNGVEMPLLSYGANLYDAATCKAATGYALQAGFRFVWSSEIIGEACQRAQAEAVSESGLPRSEVFLAGTVNTGSCADEASCYTQTAAGAQRQLQLLGVPQLDMVMLDYPSSAGCPGITGQWRALKELYAAGKARSIAVSNFDVAQLRCAAAVGPEPVVPAANQMPYNADARGSTLVEDNRQLGVVVQAYSPLGTGSLARDPVLQQIGAAHGKSAAQVALRWVVQQGVGVNLASTSLEHLREDAAVFDFELSPEEVQQINSRPSAAAVHHV